MTQLEIRSLLASVGFRGEDVFTESSGLSGGEAARLNLARLILERPNLLILDEPTNHLDIYTKDVLCESLKSYAGTIILVTHDRYLMEHLGCRLLLLEDKKGVMFENYTAYRAFAAGDVAVPAPPVSQNTTQSKDEQKASPASSKDARRERAKERERKSFLDKRIQELEISEYELESDIASPENASDHLKLADMCEQLEKVKAELDELMTEWLECYGEE